MAFTKISLRYSQQEDGSWYVGTLEDDVFDGYTFKTSLEVARQKIHSWLKEYFGLYWISYEEIVYHEDWKQIGGSVVSWKLE